MPNFICTPELARSFETADKAFVDAEKSLGSSSSFWDRIQLQHSIYSDVSEKNGHEIRPHSVLSQLEREFSPELENEKLRKIANCHGICFLDFDDTLFNCSAYLQECQSYEQMFAVAGQVPSAFGFPVGDRFNGTTKQGWVDVLQSLQRKGYLIVLCTNRSLPGKDAIYMKMREELGSCIDREIFLSYLEQKGLLMKLIRGFIAHRHGIKFHRSSMYLIDDMQTNLDLARQHGFSTVKSYSRDAMQIRTGITPQRDSYITRLAVADPEVCRALQMLMPGRVNAMNAPNFIRQLHEIPAPLPPQLYTHPSPT